MNTERIAKLKEMAAQRPHDPFFPYALALEYVSTGQNDLARSQFEEVLQRFPEYIPLYYQYAQLLSDLNETEKAKSLFTVGIEKATAAGDAKTVRELRAALDAF